ncbi:cytochrome P450 2G1-like [Amphiura filiformis]|uniref:cytochrome P450 2G1-like n=1 Tax=Amphiura filiformis TaxID=82378 RepID=UPI003B2146C3
MAASSFALSIISGSSFPSIFLMFVIIVTAVFFFQSKKSNLPPGPWTLIPYIGFAHNIAYSIYKGEPFYKFLVKLGNKHGQVYSFTALGIPIVVLNEYKAIREAFQDTKLNDRGENEMQVKAFGRTNNKWDDMGPYRIFALACFRQFGVGTSRFEEPISKESSYLIEELANLKGQAVDLTWHFNNAVSNIICKVVFGTRFELSDERIHRLTNLLNRQNELTGVGGLKRFVPITIPSKVKQEMNEVRDELHEFINSVIESHRKNFDPNNMNDVIDLWLNEIRLHKSDDPNSFRHPDNMTGRTNITYFLSGDRHNFKYTSMGQSIPCPIP